MGGAIWRLCLTPSNNPPQGDFHHAQEECSALGVCMTGRQALHYRNHIRGVSHTVGAGACLEQRAPQTTSILVLQTLPIQPQCAVFHLCVAERVANGAAVIVLHRFSACPNKTLPKGYRHCNITSNTHQYSINTRSTCHQNSNNSLSPQRQHVTETKSAPYPKWDQPYIPPPLVSATPKSQINTVPTPTVAWTRA